MLNVCSYLRIVALVSCAFPCTVLAQYGQPCSLAGPAVLPARDWKAHEVIQETLANIGAVIDTVLFSSNSSTTHLIDNTRKSFSLDIFSTQDIDGELLYNYDHTADILRNASVGVREVSSDTVYRIGSVSKLLTVYMWLLDDGDVAWNQPITNFVPGLESFAKEHAEDIRLDPTSYIDWDSVTIGVSFASLRATTLFTFQTYLENILELLSQNSLTIRVQALAAQLAGIGRDIPHPPGFDEQYYGIPYAWPMPQKSLSCQESPVCNDTGKSRDFFRPGEQAMLPISCLHRYGRVSIPIADARLTS